MKQCSKCKKIQELHCFSKLSRAKDGLQSNCKECANKYFQANKKALNEKRKAYESNNLEHIRARRNKYYRERRKKDESFKILGNLRNRLNKLIKKGNTTENLGCSAGFLKNYLESMFVNGMTWENYGKLWEVDHIYPLSKASKEGMESLKKACHYTNLRPLDISLNRSEGNRRV